MGDWEKELDRILKQSEKNKTFIDESLERYQKIADAAQAFASGFTKAAPKFATLKSDILDLAGNAAGYAVELSDLEEKLEAAKENDDKAEVKKIEAKMKPIIANVESTKKEGLKMSENGNKMDDALIDLVKSIQSAIG